MFVSKPDATPILRFLQAEKQKQLKIYSIKKSLVYLLLLPPQYDYYQQKSKKLAVASLFSGIFAAFYSTLDSKPIVMIFASKKTKTAKDVLNRKSLLLALLLLAQLQLLPLHFDFYERKSENG